MNPHQRTTSTGTTVALIRRDDRPLERLVMLYNNDAPADLREVEAGRVLGGGFQPAPFAAWALSPEVLRAIADLIDGVSA